MAHEPDDEWANMTQEEREAFIEQLDDDERREALKGLASRRKATKPPSTLGTFGSTMQQIDQAARNSLRRSAWEPEEGDIYDPTEEF